MITELDPYTTPFSTALEIADTCLDAFQDDSLYRLRLGPKYSFPVPPTAGTLDRYKRLRWTYACRQWLRIRDPAHQCFILEKDGKVVGYCAMLRAKALRERGPWIERLKSWLFEKYWRIARAFVFWNDKFYPEESPEANEFLQQGRVATGYDTPLVSEEKLAQMPRRELEEAPYPKEFMTWCVGLTLRTAYHGQGLGGQLLRYALSHVNVREPVFRNGDHHSQGPVKYCLFASPMGMPVYEKAGFAVSKEFVYKGGGETITSRLMVKVA